MNNGLKIKIKHLVDDDSTMLAKTYGTYSNTPKIGSIDRQNLGHQKRNEYRYFTPLHSAEKTGNPDAPMQDYRRAEDFSKGLWCFLIIRAEVDISINGVTQTIKSSGIHGIESDISPVAIAKEELAEIDELKTILADLGYSLTQFSDEIQIERD